MGHLSWSHHRLAKFGLALALAGCGTPLSDSCAGNACLITPGSTGDHVLEMALSARTSATVQLIIRNSGSTAFTEGVITFSPILTSGSAPSAAISSFAQRAGADARTLLQDLSLREGEAGYLVGSVAPTSTRVLTVEAPSSARISYLTISNGEIVAAKDIAIFDAAGEPVVVDVELMHIDAITGAELGPRFGSKLGVGNLVKCVVPTGMPYPVTLHDDDLNQGANVIDWPHGFGYSGTFGGSWYTDGTTARFYNPAWGGAQAGAPYPSTSGFVKFADVCPGAEATLDIEAYATTQFTHPESDTTLVVYYFDINNQLIRVDANSPTAGKNEGLLSLYDSVIPTGTRRIAVVPMVDVLAGETGTAFFDHLTIRYEPKEAWQLRDVTPKVTFTETETGVFGAGQPVGWAEFGGDWYTYTGGPEGAVATLWNPTWGTDPSQTLPADTGMTKTFPLGTRSAEELLDVRLFAAATFSTASHIQLRAVFNDAANSSYESRRMIGTTYGELWLRRLPVPADATEVTIIINGYLQEKETSSVYVDDLVVRFAKPIPSQGGRVSPVQSPARPRGLQPVSPVRMLGTDYASYAFQTNDLPDLLTTVNTRLGERQALANMDGVAFDPGGIVLANAANVRVYFIGEGAGYRNTLGYNTDGSAGLSTTSKLILPNASQAGGGWLAPSGQVDKRTTTEPLLPGDFVDIGYYAAGQALDFFLMSDGVSNNGSVVFTSNPQLNQDRRTHMVAFAIAGTSYVIIGFEDLMGGGDNDFNDVVFAVDIGAANVTALAK